MKIHESIAKIESIRDQHENNQALGEQLNNLIDMYKVLESVWAKVDGFEADIPDSIAQNAGLMSGWTFDILTAIERHILTSLKKKWNKRTLYGKLKFLSVVITMKWGNPAYVDEMLRVFETDTEGHDLEGIISLEKTTRQTIVEKRNELGSPITTEQIIDFVKSKWIPSDEEVAKAGAAKKTVWYIGNKELIIKIHRLLDTLITGYQSGKDVRQLMRQERTEFEALKTEFVVEAQKAKDASRTARDILLTQVLRKGLKWDPGILPSFNSFKDKFKDIWEVIKKIEDLERSWDPTKLQAFLNDFFQKIELQATFPKTNLTILQQIIDQSSLWESSASPKEKESFMRIMKEAYSNADSLFADLKAEEKNPDLDVVIGWVRHVFDNVEEKRKNIAILMMTVKAFSEIPTDIIDQWMRWVKDTLVWLLEFALQTSGDLWVDLSFITKILALLVWPPAFLGSVIWGVKRFGRASDIEVQDRKEQLKKIQKFVRNMWNETAANRIQRIIDGKTRLPERFYLIELHKILYKQPFYKQFLVFWAHRKFLKIGEKVTEDNRMYEWDTLWRRKTDSDLLDDVQRFAERYNAAFEEVKNSGLDDATKATLRNFLISSKIDPTEIATRIDEVKIVLDADNGLTNAMRTQIVEMVLEGKIESGDDGVKRLVPTVSNALRIQTAALGANQEKWYDAFMKRYLFKVAADGRIEAHEITDIINRIWSDVQNLQAQARGGIPMEKAIDQLSMKSEEFDLFKKWVDSKAYKMLLALETQLELDGKTKEALAVRNMLTLSNPFDIKDIPGIEITSLGEFKESLGKLFSIGFHEMLTLEELHKKQGSTIQLRDGRTFYLRGLSTKEWIALKAKRGNKRILAVEALAAAGRAGEKLDETAKVDLVAKSRQAMDWLTRIELHREVSGAALVNYDSEWRILYDDIISNPAKTLAVIETELKTKFWITGDIPSMKDLITAKLNAEGVSAADKTALLDAYDRGLSAEELDNRFKGLTYFDFLVKALRRAKI